MFGQPINLRSIWAPGQPDNYKVVEHCPELGYRENQTDRDEPKDATCNRQRLLICESRQPKTVMIGYGNNMEIVVNI